MDVPSMGVGGRGGAALTAAGSSSGSEPGRQCSQQTAQFTDSSSGQLYPLVILTQESGASMGAWHKEKPNHHKCGGQKATI